MQTRRLDHHSAGSDTTLSSRCLCCCRARRIEAIEPLTGSSFQARHSYTVDDVAPGFAHAPCVRFPPPTGGDGGGGAPPSGGGYGAYYGSRHGGAEIDFSLFHEVRKT